MKIATERERYYPAYLSNGCDTQLVGWNGAPLIMYKKVPTTVPMSDIFWSKMGRRCKTGVVMAVPTSVSLLMAGDEEFRPKRFRQSFDARRAVLETDLESNGPCWHVTTFLTHDHILVEHVTVKPYSAPLYYFIGGYEPGPMIPNRPSYTRAYYDKQRRAVVVDYKERLKVTPPSVHRLPLFMLLPRGKQQSVEIKGRTIVFGDGSPVVYQKGTFMKIGPITGAHGFTKYTGVIDNVDRPDWEKDALAIVQKCRKKGYKRILKEHEEDWRNYHARAEVKLPDDDIQSQYSMSAYVCRAMSDRQSGCFITGGLASQWNGEGPLWDAVFYVRGFLQTNHLKEAKMITDHLNRVMLPIYRKTAQAIGIKGAYSWSKALFENGMDGEFTNGTYVSNFWKVYEYMQDKDILKAYFPAMQDLVDFTLAHAVEVRKSEAVIKKIYTVEERGYDRWENDSFTCATTIAALEGLLKAAEILNISLSSSYREIYAKLKAGFRGNLKNGILQHGRDTGVTRAGFQSYYFCADLPGAVRTIKNCIKHEDKFHHIAAECHNNEETRYYPWLDLMAAVALARNKSPLAYKLIKRACRVTNSLGALPESVNIDGALWQEWFVSVAGNFLSAVSDLLAGRQGDELRLFAGIPDNWNNLSFRNIRVEGGLLVSAEVKGGRLKKLVVANTAARDCDLNIWLPARVRKYLPDTRVKIPHGRSKKFNLA